MTAIPAALLRRLAFFLALFCCRDVLGQAFLEGSPGARQNLRAGGAECGVYTLLAAARALGHPIDQKVHLEVKCVSSAAGSTSSDLIRGIWHCRINVGRIYSRPAFRIVERSADRLRVFRFGQSSSFIAKRSLCFGPLRYCNVSFFHDRCTFDAGTANPT